MVHSWFIQFSKDFQFTKPECQPPMWFLKWWSKHGSQTEIISDTLWNTEPPKSKKDPPLSTKTLKQTLNQFVQMYRCTEYISRFPPVLLFCFKYKVSWIVKWSYQIKNNILIRNFAVKCWDNFDRDRIIKFVFDEFPEIKPISLSRAFFDGLESKFRLWVNLMSSLMGSNRTCIRKQNWSYLSVTTTCNNSSLFCSYSLISIVYKPLYEAVPIMGNVSKPHFLLDL